MVIFVKKKKKKVNFLKLVLIITGVLAALAAIGTALALLKKNADAEKQKDAEIEAEITAIIEDKFAQIETEEAAGEE